jgi:hypothetical protein
MTTRIHTVRELVVALQGEDQDALVVATWEGILRAITVYHARSSWTRTAGTTDPTFENDADVPRDARRGRPRVPDHRPRDPRLLVRARLAGR